MEGMSNFVESQHARDNAGKFTETAGTEQTDILVATAPEPDWEQRARELDDEFFELHTDREARDKAWAIGEDSHRQAQYAETCDDPAVLAILARNPIRDVGLAVAKNPHTPASVIHALVMGNSPSRAFEQRAAALHNPNLDEATIRAIWNVSDKDDRGAYYVRWELARVPATPPDIISALFDRGTSGCGVHPHLPGEDLARAASDPKRVYEVITNPRLTDAQLQEALRSTAAHEYGEDDITAEFVAACVARHPHASTETVKRLLDHPDAHVRKTARDRTRSDLITSNQIAAEAEMRAAGGSDEDVRHALAVAVQMGFDGRVWGQS